MKVTHSIEGGTFKPVSVTLICESQAELDALGKFFNIHWVLEALDDVFGTRFSDLDLPSDEDIYVGFEKAGADVDLPFELNEALKNRCPK